MYLIAARYNEKGVIAFTYGASIFLHEKRAAEFGKSRVEQGAGGVNKDNKLAKRIMKIKFPGKELRNCWEFVL